MFIRKTDRIRPSYHQGFARSAGESKHPDLWKRLVGAWCPFLGVTGNRLIDQSAYKNHGTLTNMDAATDWVITENGYALDFDGIDGRVNTGDTNLNENGNFSISIWFRSDDSGTNQLVLYSEGNLSDNDYFTFISLNNTVNGRLLFALRSEGSPSDNIIVSDDGNYADDNWHNVIGVRTATNTINLYVDGLFKNTLTGTLTNLPIIWNTSAIGMLARAVPSGFYPDLIDQVITWNCALSSSEVMQLYQNPYALFELRDDIYGFVPIIAALSVRDASVLFLKSRKSISIQQQRKSVRVLN